MEQQDALLEVSEELQRMAEYLSMVASHTCGSPSTLEDVSQLLSSTRDEVKRAMASSALRILH